jgi:hypothetical protein
MKSDTSSEINVNYLDKNGNKLETKTEVKRQSSDTDYYFGMVANQEKVINLKSESSSDLDNIVNSSSSSKSSSSSSSSKKSKSSSSKPKIDNLNFTASPVFKPPPESRSSYESRPSTNIPFIEPTNVPIKNLSPQEIRMKKIELLRRLSEIKSKGYNLTKEYDFNSSIEEMEYEYALLKSFADKRNGTKLYKNILLNGISLLEFVNDKYDPFEFKLNGWSEHMSVEIDSYEDIIEELYEKYKSTGKSTPPEVRLIFLIFASGAAFHFSKTQLGGIPGVSSAATGMIGKMMAGDKKESQFMSPQEINLEKQKQLLREREKQLRQQLAQNKTSNQQMPRQMPQQTPQQMNQSFDQQQINQNYTMQPPSIPQFRSNTRDVPEIRAPENVQEILSRIQTINKNNTSINTTETQEESTTNNDRLVSDSTYSDNKKRGGRKAKKPVISINTN